VIILRSEAPTLREDEEDAVSDAIRWVKDKSAAQVADESHKLSWGWQRRRTGDIIDVQFDGLDYEEVEVLKAEAKKITNNLSWAKSAATGSIWGIALSDRLAKSFDKYLFLAVENHTSARIRLLRLGWKESRDNLSGRNGRGGHPLHRRA
jgi:hypothetical protein